ncbi:MAG: hypothetical protein HY020_00990 [Burkholderiales bacterium]|nr:hypothetical protein [Burkholderiales bacterium]
MRTSWCGPEALTSWENDMMRAAFPWFGLCLSGAVLAYCFLVAAGA